MTSEELQQMIGETLAQSLASAATERAANPAPTEPSGNARIVAGVMRQFSDALVEQGFTSYERVVLLQTLLRELVKP